MRPMEEIQLQVYQFIDQVSKTGVGIEPGVWLNEDAKQLSIKLLKEEFGEMMKAIDEDDWPEIIDGAADTIFVILFAMAKSGINLSDYWDEVCYTNRAKAGGPKDPVTGKQLKPPGWKPPRIEKMLNLERSRREQIKELGLPFEVIRAGGGHRRALHILKTAHEPFEAVWSERKRYEWRKNDRHFAVGDSLVLREYDVEEHIYSGRELIVRVLHVTVEGDMAQHYHAKLSPDTNWVVMSLELLAKLDANSWELSE